MRVDSVIRNPTLYYKLDPGEMGIAAPAKASESVLRVTAHELGNIHRFEAEAAMEGGIVIYENISLDLAFEGSFLAARAGKSEAKIIYRRKGKRLLIDKLGVPKNKERAERDLQAKRNRIRGKIERVRRDPTLTLRERERKVEELERKLREIEKLLRLVRVGIPIPYRGAALDLTA
ncbi:MAG: hypothetical protein J7M13_00120 [Synergistetes bacterium]|nr:hypothetical protein [Synergistota bacterium]